MFTIEGRQTRPARRAVTKVNRGDLAITALVLAVAAAILAVLIVAAIAVTIVTTGQATRGIGGTSARQAVIYGMSWPAGFIALFVIEGALSHAGASNAVMGVIGATGPLLVTGLIYLMAAALWLDRTMFGFGIWLLGIAAIGGWTGPVGALLTGALAGGGGFLAVAAYLAGKTPYLARKTPER